MSRRHEKNNLAVWKKIIKLSMSLKKAEKLTQNIQEIYEPTLGKK